MGTFEFTFEFECYNGNDAKSGGCQEVAGGRGQVVEVGRNKMTQLL